MCPYGRTTECQLERKWLQIAIDTTHTTHSLRCRWLTFTCFLHPYQFRQLDKVAADDDTEGRMVGRRPDGVAG